MSDSTSEGWKTACARANGVSESGVGHWLRQGMPDDPEGADAWLKKHKRGRHRPLSTLLAPPAEEVVAGAKKRTGTLRKRLEGCEVGDPGVWGMYARAEEVELAAFQRTLSPEAGASDVTAHTTAMRGVSEAAKLVAAAEEADGNLRPMEQISAAIRHQWQTASTLLDNLEGCAHLLTGQTDLKVVKSTIRRETDRIKERLLETYPFAGPLPADMGEAIEDPAGIDDEPEKPRVETVE